MNLGPRLPGERTGDRDPRETAARTQISPHPGLGRQIQELERIGNMAGPQRGKRRWRDEIEFALPAQELSTKISSRASVSRETGTSARARALSSPRLRVPCPFLLTQFSLTFFAAPNVRNKQRQRRRRDAVDAARMSDRARTMRL